MYVWNPCVLSHKWNIHTCLSCLKSNKNHPEAPPKHVCMFQNPQPVMENETYTFKHTRSKLVQKRPKARLKRLLSMYVCLKTLCLSWKTKHTRSNMNLRTQLRLKKIKENATPIEDSSCRIITNQRKRYPYRGIDVCIFVYVWTESKNPLPVRVFASVLSATQPNAWVFEFTPTRRLY